MNYDIFAIIKTYIFSLLQRKYSFLTEDSIRFETPLEELGHISLNCFVLAKTFKKSAPLVAEEISNFLQEVSQEATEKEQYFSHINSTGAYVNFFLQAQILADNLLPQILNGNEYGKFTLGNGKKILIEFSAPNTNKPLHLGHARNNMIGYTFAKILDFCGFQVIRVNLVNDRGIHICQSMLAYQMYGDNKTPQTENVKGDHFVGNFYVRFHTEKTQNPEMEATSYKILKQWEQGETTVKKLWKKMNEWVLSGFQETYQRMGITFDKYYFESDTYQKGKEIVCAASARGVCQKDETGAIKIDLTAEKLGEKILLRADGTSLYITQDIQTTIVKFSDFNIDQAIWVVGNEQDHHFKVLFQIFKKFGYAWADKCMHISYAMIHLPEGKMKSREGKIVDLDKLMDNLQEQAFQELDKRDEGILQRTTENSQKAEDIGQAALKFFILNTHIKKERLFYPEKSLKFEGQTGPYLQYTYARIQSLLNKTQLHLNTTQIPNYDWNKSEFLLLLHCAKFPTAIKTAFNKKDPLYVAQYTYNLCRSFNQFYYENPIIKNTDEKIQKTRLLLSLAVVKILEHCFIILGIKALQKM